jgi:hypothetical protein
MTNAYIARQAQKEVPVWDLVDATSNFVIGYMTSFPGEGPTATVRLHKGAEGVTVQAGSLHTCLYLAREAYEGLYDANECGAEDYEFIEDEDGEIAAMKNAEYEAEKFSPRYGYNDEEPFFN